MGFTCPLSRFPLLTMRLSIVLDLVFELLYKISGVIDCFSNLVPNDDILNLSVLNLDRYHTNNTGGYIDFGTKKIL